MYHSAIRRRRTAGHYSGDHMHGLGLTYADLQDLIEQQMTRLDEAQEEEEHLGPYGDLLRTATLIAFHRAADLIDANNKRLSEQLRSLGIGIE